MHLHAIHHQRSNIGQMLPILCSQRLARMTVGQADGANVMTIRRRERYPGIKADKGVAMNQRTVAEAGIFQRIGHAEDIAPRQRMMAEGDVARRTGNI